MNYLTKPNDTTFPVVVTKSREVEIGTGLTKREYFAAMALQGLLSNASYMNDYNKDKYLLKPWTVSKVAIEYANALIVELNKDQE